MQKKNRKGFTLIELLAVIVILAIIALIAVPVIMNVITKARVSAFEDSAYGIVKAGEMYYTNKLLDAEGMKEDQEFTVNGDAFQNTKNSAETLDLSGSIPSNGKVTVTSEGKVAIAISNGEYCIRKATTESKVETKKLSDLEGGCDYKKIASSIFTTTTDGKDVPACIKNNTTCDVAAAGNDGLKVGVKVNDTKTYDFYVMSEDTDEETITLIMNQNLGESPWISKDDYVAAGGTETDYGDYGNYNKGPLTALKALEDRTSSWTNIPFKEYTYKDVEVYLAITRTARARLIATEEAYDLSLINNSWLYENLSNYEGYWTSSGRVPFSDSAVFVNSYDASGYENYAYVLYDYGIRPVITISKTTI